MHSNEMVSIRPGVQVLSVLRHLNYRPWFALAEFVDNSIQSYKANCSELVGLDGESYKLHVDILIESSDKGTIKIRDNAGGIHEKDFSRAFRPAEVPPDVTGLSEYGMGMKSAACWFSPKWEVRTSALGEKVEKTVKFDIDKIVTDRIEELQVFHRETLPSYHYTEIILSQLHNIPVGRTISKIKEHLKDIYRIFIREGSLILTLNGQELKYSPPKILNAPHYKDTKEEKSIKWLKKIDFDFGEGMNVKGFAAIMEKANTSGAGFALFRRNRLIQGSADEGYRPEYIFKKPNSYIYQRVFGELHLNGFDVSHTKDGFRWDENEQPFLEILKEELSKEDFPLLQQAREYRVNRGKKDYKKGADDAVKSTSNSLEEYGPPVLDDISADDQESNTPENLEPETGSSKREIIIYFNEQEWKIIIELSYNPAVGDWLEISDDGSSSTADERRTVNLRLSMLHPFMQRFCGVDKEEIEPIIRIAAALGLAEIMAKNSGIRYVARVRKNVNKILLDALSKA